MPPSKVMRNVHQRDPKSQSSTAIHQHKAPGPSRNTNIFPVPKCDPICQKWPMILRTIVRKMNHPGLLDNNYLSGVAVDFVRGDFVRGSSGLNANELDRRAIQLPPMLGQSLALNNASGSGTLGGFLELKMPGEAKYRTMVLTCFHCVNPSETGLDRALVKRLRVWRQEGIAPDDNMRTELQVQHPSRTAVKEKIKSLKDAICAIEENDEYVQLSELEGDIESICGRSAAKAFSRMTSTLCELKEFLRDIEAFKQADRGYFGPVYAGSGFRETCSTTPSNLDWALIEIPHDRVGENITPDGHYLKDSPMPKDLDGIPLFIHGQRSGYCRGKKDTFDTAVLSHEIEEDTAIARTTYEHPIRPQGGAQFSQDGDSGSFVFTESYVVVGMLFAGGTSHMMSFFTPIGDVLNDIKTITKAVDVRLKVRPGTS
ncbi:hypothetical protein HAV15_003966 [Penicillium sp. str. |nr:hypothetical protein HAV15_003966 [Penicillium sp. str. \